RILGIDGQTYDLPTMNEIRTAILKNKEMFETKMKQGFTELEIVPFAMPLSKLIETLKRQLLKHHKEGKLFYVKRNKESKIEELMPFDLDINEPVYINEMYANADEKNELVYDVNGFSYENHQGKTKKQLINAQKSIPGYLIIFREGDMNMPEEGKGKIINGRKQLEIHDAPKKYLKLIQTEKQYQGESGQTPEEWIVEFLCYMEKNDQVIDCQQGSFQLGVYLVDDAYILYSRSILGNKMVKLERKDPNFEITRCGARTSVRINGF
ncbi:MAG: hypothetical protein WAZ64_01270, partial [Candidatus Moraniibacteriota bacterium]